VKGEGIQSEGMQGKMRPGEGSRASGQRDAG